MALLSTADAIQRSPTTATTAMDHAAAIRQTIANLQAAGWAEEARLLEQDLDRLGAAPSLPDLLMVLEDAERLADSLAANV
jgi:hypothetical protein